MEKEIKALNKTETDDASEPSVAMGKLMLEMNEKTNKSLKFVCIVLAISIIANLAIVGAFLWYEAHMEFTETITQTVDGESSQINNKEYRDNSVHNEGVDPTPDEKTRE